MRKNKEAGHRETRQSRIRQRARFARFNPDGSVEIFDLKKAEEIGATVSVVTRKEGRGKAAREVRITEIKMPNKLPALLKLLEQMKTERHKDRGSFNSTSE